MKNFSIEDIDVSLGELYDAVVSDHAARPRNFRAVENATSTIPGVNPSCGDEIVLSVKIDPAEQKVVDIGFTGHGCTICMASSSLMTLKVKGKSCDEAKSLLNNFQAMIFGQPDGERAKELGDLRVLNGVRKFPLRVKCATLAWYALKAALGSGSSQVVVNPRDEGF